MFSFFMCKLYNINLRDSKDVLNEETGLNKSLPYHLKTPHTNKKESIRRGKLHTC